MLISQELSGDTYEFLSETPDHIFIRYFHYAFNANCNLRTKCFISKILRIIKLYSELNQTFIISAYLHMACRVNYYELESFKYLNFRKINENLCFDFP